MVLVKPELRNMIKTCIVIGLTTFIFIRMPGGLALIDYKLVSVLILIADEIMPIGLELIDYKLCPC